jgi:hypothetical protein
MIELSKINIEEINDSDQLIDIAQHAGKVSKKITDMTSAYEVFTEFLYFCAEIEEDGLIHLKLSKLETEPDVTFTPSDWYGAVIHLRDVYFPAVRASVELIKKGAIAKADLLVNG